MKLLTSDPDVWVEYDLREESTTVDLDGSRSNKSDPGTAADGRDTERSEENKGPTRRGGTQRNQRGPSSIFCL